MVLGSGIRDPGSGKKPIPDPGSRGQKGTGSRIRIRNTVISLQFDLVAGIHMEHAESRDSCCHPGTSGKADIHYLASDEWYCSGYL